MSANWKNLERKAAKTLNGIRQAERYDPDKIPVLILKERNMRGELIILRLADFQDLFGEIKPLNDGYNAVT